jgi:DegV family protein with EDD domain
MTDSCADLPVSVVADLGLEVLRFPYAIAGTDYIDDSGASLGYGAFYDLMRAGEHPTTAQIPYATLVERFSAHAQAGVPACYLALSSALSATFDMAWLARNEVLSRYPEAELAVIDTKAASVAQGLLVYEAARRWNGGATIEELTAWFAAERPRLNGWFTIDDLETLRRGGRLPGAAAAAGTLLDVKPLLHVADDGRLELKRSIRGRQKSMRTLADLLAERGEDLAGQTIAIAHGDCPEDAARLAELVAERADVAGTITMDVGPVIGAHTGPGMLALVFWGRPQ